MIQQYLTMRPNCGRTIAAGYDGGLCRSTQGSLPRGSPGVHLSWHPSIFYSPRGDLSVEFRVKGSVTVYVHHHLGDAWRFLTWTPPHPVLSPFPRVSHACVSVLWICSRFLLINNHPPYPQPSSSSAILLILNHGKNLNGHDRAKQDSSTLLPQDD